MDSGNITPPATPVTRGKTGKVLFLLFLAPSFLAACQHRDAAETATGWWHDFEGGEIAKLRPPPPGQDAPYPHLGRTPTQSPEMPSPDARQNLTSQLEAQRNLAQRESAARGPLPTPPPAPPKPAPTPSANATSDSQTGLSMPSAGTPAPDTATEASLPPVVLASIPPTPPGQYPQIGANPPPAPQFPGFDIPQDAHVTAPLTPDLNTRTPPGTLIRFEPATDHVSGNPDSAYQHILSGQHGKTLTITGFGTTMSADAGLSASDQAREISLGLLRARVVAEALIKRGAQPASLQIRGEAIGDGVRVH